MGMNNFVYVYSPDRTRLINPLIILCCRGCVKVRDRDAYELFVGVEPNRDVIWSRDIGDCSPVSSMAALPVGSACMMLPNYGDQWNPRELNATMRRIYRSNIFPTVLLISSLVALIKLAQYGCNQ